MNRYVLLCALAVAALPAASAQSQTPPYPTRVITLVAPFPPGGPSDTTARLIVGQRINSHKEQDKLKALFQRTLEGAFADKGWTVYIDELQIAADRRMMNLMSNIELMLIASRDRFVSMVTSYQRPANVPKTASNQATWLVIYHTRDRDTVDTIAHMMGRPKDEVRGVVGELPKHCIVIVNRSPRMPMLVTLPDPL